MLQLVTSTELAVVLDNVTLECELYGYFDTVPPITWNFGDLSIPLDNPTYTITTRDGDKFIQDGGETIRPSVISTLSFLAEDESLSGRYVCLSMARTRTVSLAIVQG